MRVLLLGGGGREHALAWKINQSKRLTKLYVAPGNAGTCEVAENVNIRATDFEEVARFIKQEAINLLVVGPEEPLVAGIRDYLEADGSFPSLVIVGPGRAGAALEGSKEFAKGFMTRHGIPTAAYCPVTSENRAEGIAFLRRQRPPYVLKADGLAAGKGVLIVEDPEEAARELGLMLEGKFGKAGERVVIEEFLRGIELSVFVLTDGKEYKILGSAKDYKRAGEGDTGLNTGGMGAISPVPFADAAFNRAVEERIIIPTIRGLRADGIAYKGFIFFGLMKVGDEPFVIEYNVRLGDPETEVVIPRLTSDLLSLFEAMERGTLREAACETTPRYQAAVMLTARGYPGPYEKGQVITGLHDARESLVFHAGTAARGDAVVTNGGRVIAISSRGDTLEEALQRAYQDAGRIHFEGKYFRRDIGKDVKGRE
ncbi:MAG: phosphoribosylamine--glycine ligase [Odoribacteraceae bacterium]|jgi:phosphoribosylamine--glycine ligase|nr:phosphoribosylamine--glycine ligase [Odoribacteraceae bacterium]